MGKPLDQSRRDSVALARYLEFYGGAADKLMGSTIPYQQGYTAYTLREPHGVVLVIAPWNYPMAMSVSDALPAIVAGNAVVVKPDSQTPYCTLANAELLYQAGVPKEIFAVIPGPGSVVGNEIAESVDYLMFTGSSNTGRRLAEQAGRRLIGISAELGGKNPMIVLEGANIAKVAKAATRACFSNAGQLCISIERIYVEDSVADEFIAKFGANVENMKLGSTYDYSTDMGSLISGDQLKTVADHVDDAVLKGATVIAGGKPRPDLGPCFYEPTVLTDVTDEHPAMAEEIFGPVLPIVPVADVQVRALRTLICLTPASTRVSMRSSDRSLPASRMTLPSASVASAASTRPDTGSSTRAASPGVAVVPLSSTKL